MWVDGHYSLFATSLHSVYHVYGAAAIKSGRVIAIMTVEAPGFKESGHWYKAIVQFAWPFFVEGPFSVVLADFFFDADLRHLPRIFIMNLD